MSLLLKMDVMMQTTIAENAEMRLLTITVSNVLPSHKKRADYSALWLIVAMGFKGCFK